MAVNSGKKSRKVLQSDNRAEEYVAHKFKEITTLNYAQQLYVEAIEDSEIIFGIGSAGTGKTFIATHYAANQLYHKRIERVILTRPNVEVGRGLGFLPGTIEEKYEPYLEPFDAIFSKFLGKGFYEYCLKSKSIDPRPLTHMRGATFDNCIVLVDECQNMTKTEFKMMLSRIGKNCKFILSGDPSQADIPGSGLQDAVDRLKHIAGVSTIKFEDSDIVRSRMCKEIILAYNN
jgi:phosphate starvation-inducible PhoH-like protein